MWLSGKSVLIVEDKEDFQKRIMEVVQVLGCLNHTVIDNAKETIEILDKEKFDLIVLDLKLRQSNGLEVLEEVRKKNISIPILIFSAYIDEYKRKILQYMGGNASVKMITKDYDFYDLSQEINALMELHSCQDVKNVVIPGLQDKIVSLESKIGTLEENNPANWDLKKELKDLGLQIILKNKKSIAVIITSLIGLIISSISGLSMNHITETTKIISDDIQGTLENISDKK